MKPELELASQSDEHLLYVARHQQPLQAVKEEQEQTPARTTPPVLCLVKSFDQQAYPYEFNYKIIYDPASKGGDGLFKDHPGYPEFKIMARVEQAIEHFRFYLQKAGIDDYCLFRTGDILNTYFKTSNDRYVAEAIMHPMFLYDIGVMPCRPNVSSEVLTKRARRLQDIYNNAGLAGRVTFSAHYETKKIRVDIKNGFDVAEFSGVTRALGFRGIRNLYITISRNEKNPKQPHVIPLQYL